jgi:ketosteroid isomerase-like protein
VHVTSNDPKTVADRFFKAWTTGDFDTARSLLHDDVSFSGPIDRFDNADAYLGALRGLSQIVKGAEEQKVFVDGDDVCVIYDLVTNTPAGTAPTAEWYHLRDGKISAVRVYFDARPFAPVFEQRPD